MKFDTKFGIGEIVYYTRMGHPKAQHDSFLEVVAISITRDHVTYCCRYDTGIVSVFTEKDLIGDEEFNQETGEYPYNIEEAFSGHDT